jgi:FixJ family two-component response regulator
MSEAPSFGQKKPYREEALLGAIEAAFVNGSTSVRAEKIADATRRANTPSSRERKVLQGLIDDSSNKMIAHQLALAYARSRFTARV